MTYYGSSGARLVNNNKYSKLEMGIVFVNEQTFNEQTFNEALGSRRETK